MTHSVDESQRRAARVVGFVYLFAMATSIFTEAFARGQLIVPDNAAETARNIVAHERLFRLGIASYLLCMASDVALIAGLYVILERVNRNIALFAAFMRLMETAIGVVATLNSINVLLLASAADNLRGRRTQQLQVLVGIPRNAYCAVINGRIAIQVLGSAA